VPLEGAARELRGALRRGELVALVADRDITGNGRPTALFGAPASLPIGPAVLADESGAAVYVVGVRRTAPGEYRARLIRLPEAPGRSLRQRVDVFLANEVAALELLIADAPAQWWTVLFPIWEEPAAKASTSPDDVRLAA
jgi:KDO2-lipid IV(A) lauroyltransferase